jgi:hypothetical protein
MNKTVLFFLLLIICSEANGQWYVKKYNVQDPNMLSREQLDSSYKSFKSGGYTWLGVTAVGGLGFLMFKYLKPGMSDDPGIIQQLLGDEGVNKVGQYVCVLLAGAGLVGSLVHLARCEKIKNILRNNFPASETFRISPALIPNSYARTYTPGVTLSFRF